MTNDPVEVGWEEVIPTQNWEDDWEIVGSSMEEEKSKEKTNNHVMTKESEIQKTSITLPSKADCASATTITSSIPTKEFKVSDNALLATIVLICYLIVVATLPTMVTDSNNFANTFNYPKIYFKTDYNLKSKKINILKQKTSKTKKLLRSRVFWAGIAHNQSNKYRHPSLNVASITNSSDGNNKRSIVPKKMIQYFFTRKKWHNKSMVVAHPFAENMRVVKILSQHRNSKRSSKMLVRCINQCSNRSQSLMVLSSFVTFKNMTLPRRNDIVRMLRRRANLIQKMSKYFIKKMSLNKSMIVVQPTIKLPKKYNSSKSSMLSKCFSLPLICPPLQIGKNNKSIVPSFSWIELYAQQNQCQKFMRLQCSSSNRIHTRLLGKRRTIGSTNKISRALSRFKSLGSGVNGNFNRKKTGNQERKTILNLDLLLTKTLSKTTSESNMSSLNIVKSNLFNINPVFKISQIKQSNAIAVKKRGGALVNKMALKKIERRQSKSVKEHSNEGRDNEEPPSFYGQRKCAPFFEEHDIDIPSAQCSIRGIVFCNEEGVCEISYRRLKRLKHKIKTEKKYEYHQGTF